MKRFLYPVLAISLVTIHLLSASGSFAHADKSAAGLNASGCMEINQKNNGSELSEQFIERASSSRYANKSSGKFLKARRRKMKRTNSRTCVVSPGKKSRHTWLWNRITKLKEYQKGQILWFTSAYFPAEKKDINPAYIKYMKKQSTLAYQGLKQYGKMNLGITVYTYPGCNKTALYQTAPAKDWPSEELYRGGSITDFKKGSSMTITTCYDHKQKHQKYESMQVKLDQTSMQPPWYLDVCSESSMYLCIPYRDYLKFCHLQDDTVPDQYIIQTRKHTQNFVKKVQKLLWQQGTGQVSADPTYLY